MENALQVPLSQSFIAITVSILTVVVVLILKRHIDRLNQAYTRLPLPGSAPAEPSPSTSLRRIRQTTWVAKILLIAWPIPLAVFAVNLLILNKALLGLALPGVGLVAILALVFGAVGKLHFAAIFENTIDWKLAAALGSIGLVGGFTVVLCLRVLPDPALRAELLGKIFDLGG